MLAKYNAVNAIFFVVLKFVYLSIYFKECFKMSTIIPI